MTLELDNKLILSPEVWRAANLTDKFSPEDLVKIGAYVHEGFTRDKASRFRWEQRNEAGMNLALQLQEAKSFPWPGCANVAFPLVTIAAMQFHARAYPAIISGTDIVKCQVFGDDPLGKETQRAARISGHMSWQCYEEDQSWEEQHDRGLLNVAIVGTNFMKTYRNAEKDINAVSELVLARDLVLDYFAKSVEECPRKTQIIDLPRNLVWERCARKAYRDVREETWFRQPAVRTVTQLQLQKDQRQGMQAPSTDMNTPFMGLEQHVDMDLDGDGYSEPYIITIEESTKTVLRVVCNWDREEDIERIGNEIVRIRPRQYYTKYGLIPSPDGSVYDIGFGVLLGPLNESVNSAINQLFDAGTMSVAAGGFLSRGVKIRGGTYQFSPFGWNRVDSTGDDLRKGVFPLPVREPNSVLFQLLSLLIDYTNRVSGANDMMVGENPGQNTPASTAQAMIEQGSKIYAAIFKRIWRCMKEEFKKRYILNAIYMRPEQRWGANKVALKADYLGNPDAIAPAADPNITSESQKLMQVQAVKASAMQTPGYDGDAVERWFLKTMKVADIDTIFPGTEKRPPGPSEKIQIQQMKMQVEMARIQADQAQESARLAMDYQRLQYEIATMQAELALKQAELQGDTQDREIQRMNGMLSLMKDQAASTKARLDLLAKQMELRGKVIEGEYSRVNAEIEARLALEEASHARREQNREDRKVAQKDRELDIKQQMADKPAAGGK